MNPSCPFCGAVLRADDHKNAMTIGMETHMGLSKVWRCVKCNHFWPRKSNSLIKGNAQEWKIPAKSKAAGKKGEKKEATV